MWSNFIEQSLGKSENSSLATNQTKKYFLDLLQLNNLLDFSPPKFKIIWSKFPTRRDFSPFSSFSPFQWISDNKSTRKLKLLKLLELNKSFIYFLKPIIKINLFEKQTVIEPSQITWRKAE